MLIPTVKIKTDYGRGWAIINESDFDPEVHERFDAPTVASRPQLDHDGDGKAGGSTKPPQTDDLAALRAEYQDVLGKRPFNGWDAGTLRKKIAEAED